MASTSAPQDVAAEAEDEKDAHENSLYKEDSFRMYCMKVLPCSKRYCHDWTTCPFSHPGEKARRRDPRTQPHTGIACPDRKKEGTCVRGDSCPYAHNVFEYWLHPTRYRTQLCNDGIKCKRHICFFAHSLEELRVPTCKPFVPPDALAAATSAAAADIARKAGGGGFDAATLRSLADSVLAGMPQSGAQAMDAAHNLDYSAASADALARQLAQMQMQQQQVNYRQQQPEQLDAVSFLTAYLREAQQQQQAQQQNQHQNQQQAQQQPASQHATSLPFDSAWPSAMSERQQLAFRSLSEAAADRAEGPRSGSEMLRAALTASSVTPSTIPGETMQSPASPHPLQLPAAATAGLSLAQQSLLYAPSQQERQAAQRNHQLFQQHQFAPFPARNPLGSSRSSIDTGFRWSDPGRRPSYSHHDWMSTGSGPSRYSIESDFVSTGRRSSIGPLNVRGSLDVDWAGRPLGRADAAAFTHGSEAFNPFSSYTPFHNLQDPVLPRTPSDAYPRRPFRASQDSAASTFMHADSRRSVDDRPSMESVRSGFGSPPVESFFNANSSRGGDSLFAFSGGGHQQQQQHSGFGRQSSGNLSLSHPNHTAPPPPLGSGRSLETMPEDEDPRGMY